MKHAKNPLLLSAILITAIAGNSAIAAFAAESTSDDWTVLLYLCGSDLESDGGCGTLNLEEAMAAKYGDSVNFIVETGGCTDWQTSEIKNDVLQRWEIRDGSLNELDSLSYSSMGSADTLSDFVTWGMTQYPAENTALILWDHGGGSLYGVCWDDHYEDDALTLPELESALGTAVENAGRPVTLVGFDACLMASLETADAIDKSAQYMVASEESEPGEGWDYTVFMNYLGENPDATAVELGTSIADSFYEKCTGLQVNSMVTMSVINLEYIEALDTAFNTFTDGCVMLTQNDESLKKLERSANGTETYGSNNRTEGYTNLLDLGGFVRGAESVLKDSSEAVQEVLDKAVEYEVHGAQRAGAGGLSVVYPLHADEELMQLYAQISDNTSYQQYFSILADTWSESDWTISTSDDGEGVWDYLDSLDGSGPSGSDEYYEDQSGSDEYYDDQNAGDEGDGDWFDLMSGDEENYDGQSGSGDGGWFDSMSGGEENYDDNTDWLDGLVGPGEEGFCPVQSGNYTVSLSQKIDSDNHLCVYADSGAECLERVEFMLVYEEPGSGEYVILGTDNLIDADWENGVFRDDFQGTWLTVDGNIVCAELIDERDDYLLYSIPAIVNGKETPIRIAWIFDENCFKVLGAYDGIDEETGASEKDMKALKAGDEVIFLLYALDKNLEETEPYESQTLIWTDDTTVEDEILSDGEYYYMMTLYDHFNNSYDSDMVKVTMEDGYFELSEL